MAPTEALPDLADLARPVAPEAVRPGDRIAVSVPADHPDAVRVTVEGEPDVIAFLAVRETWVSRSGGMYSFHLGGGGWLPALAYVPEYVQNAPDDTPEA